LVPADTVTTMTPRNKRSRERIDMVIAINLFGEMVVAPVVVVVLVMKSNWHPVL
jgi:hypothetical protein